MGRGCGGEGLSLDIARGEKRKIGRGGGDQMSELRLRQYRVIGIWIKAVDGSGSTC